MEIRAGWATDYGHVKYDVSTDETDLARILIHAGIRPAFHAKITAEDAWAILDAEARWLAEHALARYLEADGHQGSREAAQKRAAGAREDRNEALKRVYTKLGLRKEEPSGGQRSARERQLPSDADGSAGAAASEASG